MKVNWRLIHSARNSYAALYAACEQSGFILHPVKEPAGEITCYSLNSINEPGLRDEITNADCVTIIGGSHATARYQDVIRYADYVVVGEGEYTLPRLLAAIEQGTSTAIPGVATKDHYEPADTDVRLDAYPAFSEMKGYVEISRGCPFSCGYCQTPQMFGHCMRHRSIDAVAQYANRYEHARFVSPNAFAYGSDGVHPLGLIRSNAFFTTSATRSFLAHFHQRFARSLYATHHLSWSRSSAPTPGSISVPSLEAMQCFNTSKGDTRWRMLSEPWSSAGTTG